MTRTAIEPTEKSNQSYRLLFLCLFGAMLLPFAASLFYIVILKGSLWARVIYAITKIFMVAFPIATVLLVEKQKLSISQFDWSKHLRAIPLGLAAGGFLVVLIWGLYRFTPLNSYLGQYVQIIRTKAEHLGILNHYWAFTLFLSLGHSLLEEYY